ncbi:hypothetical protein GDO86_016806 [Hymenochirus boettgeri]|uniref:Uncharacterized protein n=1 Tax=Hymenochirus boettgeri TaxID=247094 RepID=A0A8T2IP43_9PIPI|nr:hypothetical protein GDO86_016806 [Hymenochirus boettgeri]
MTDVFQSVLNNFIWIFLLESFGINMQKTYLWFYRKTTQRGVFLTEHLLPQILNQQVRFYAVFSVHMLPLRYSVAIKLKVR